MFDHVTIRVRDRAAAELFYTTVLIPLGIEKTYRTNLFSEWQDFALAHRKDGAEGAVHVDVRDVAPELAACGVTRSGREVDANEVRERQRLGRLRVLRPSGWESDLARIQHEPQLPPAHPGQAASEPTSSASPKPKRPKPFPR